MDGEKGMKMGVENVGMPWAEFCDRHGVMGKEVIGVVLAYGDGLVLAHPEEERERIIELCRSVVSGRDKAGVVGVWSVD